MKRTVTLLAASSFMAITAVASFMATTASAEAIPFSYNARPVTIVDTPGETSLQDVIDGAIGTGNLSAALDQSKVGAWTMAEGATDAYRVALVSPQTSGSLNIFSLSNGNEYTILDASSAGTVFHNDFRIAFNKNTGSYVLFVNDVEIDTNFGQTFGYIWQVDQSKSYTLDSLNPNGSAQALSYLVGNGTPVTLNDDPFTTETTALGNNDWILAFDNLFSASPAPQRLGLENGIDTPAGFNDAVFYIEDMNPVPEPGTMMLLGAGLLGLAIYSKRRKNA